MYELPEGWPERRVQHNYEIDLNHQDGLRLLLVGLNMLLTMEVLACHAGGLYTPAIMLGIKILHIIHMSCRKAMTL